MHSWLDQASFLRVRLPCPKFMDSKFPATRPLGPGIPLLAVLPVHSTRGPWRGPWRGSGESRANRPRGSETLYAVPGHLPAGQPPFCSWYWGKGDVRNLFARVKMEAWAAAINRTNEALAPAPAPAACQPGSPHVPSHVPPTRYALFAQHKRAACTLARNSPMAAPLLMHACRGPGSGSAIANGGSSGCWLGTMLLGHFGDMVPGHVCVGH